MKQWTKFEILERTMLQSKKLWEWFRDFAHCKSLLVLQRNLLWIQHSSRRCAVFWKTNKHISTKNCILWWKHISSTEGNILFLKSLDKILNFRTWYNMFYKKSCLNYASCRKDIPCSVNWQWTYYSNYYSNII